MPREGNVPEEPRPSFQTLPVVARWVSQRDTRERQGPSSFHHK